MALVSRLPCKAVIHQNKLGTQRAVDLRVMPYYVERIVVKLSLGMKLNKQEAELVLDLVSMYSITDPHSS